jgi:anti-sigma B factor antagonist
VNGGAGGGGCGDGLYVSARLSGRIAVLSLDGVLDGTSAPRLTERVADAVAHKARHVVLDLTALRGADTEGLVALARVARSLRDGGVTLALAATRPELAYRVRRLGVTRIATLFPSVEAATVHLQRLGAGGGR